MSEDQTNKPTLEELSWIFGPGPKQTEEDAREDDRAREQAEAEQRELERMLYRLAAEWKGGIVQIQLDGDWFSISVWDGDDEIAFERAVLPAKEVIEICYRAAFGGRDGE